MGEERGRDQWCLKKSAFANVGVWFQGFCVYIKTHILKPLEPSLPEHPRASWSWWFEQALPGKQDRELESSFCTRKTLHEFNLHNFNRPAFNHARLKSHKLNAHKIQSNCAEKEAVVNAGYQVFFQRCLFMGNIFLLTKFGFGGPLYARAV